MTNDRPEAKRYQVRGCNTNEIRTADGALYFFDPARYQYADSHSIPVGSLTCQSIDFKVFVWRKQLILNIFIIRTYACLGDWLSTFHPSYRSRTSHASNSPSCQTIYIYISRRTWTRTKRQQAKCITDMMDIIVDFTFAHQPSTSSLDWSFSMYSTLHGGASPEICKCHYSS